MIAHKHKGAHSELIACSWLLCQGYEVFRNISQSGPIDLIGLKDGVLHFFEVRTVRPGCKSRLRPDQMGKGIKIINVCDRECSIDDEPMVQGGIPRDRTRRWQQPYGGSGIEIR